MRTPTVLAMAAALALAVVPFAHANESTAVHVSDAWIRVLPGNLPNAGYAVLSNDSDKAAKLVSADSPAYGRVMLHQSSETGGVSRMHKVDSLTIPAHGKIKLAPGGYHLMLMKRAVPVKPGMKIEIRLQFSDGSTLDGHFLARPANATSVSD